MIVEAACYKNNIVEMMYSSKKGVITKRKVKIIGISDNAILGYCYLRKKLRTFRKEQILALFPEKIA